MKSMKIYFTSDTHGKVMPVDYASGNEKACGLLDISCEIQKDENTLVLDGGDSLQGTPFVQYYLEHTEEFGTHPVAEGFNAMGLDAYTLGNHDFNFGYDVIREYARAMTGTLVCANVEDLRGELPMVPWKIVTLGNGLRVGITGAVTDHVNVWEKKEHLTELRVLPPIPAVQKAYDEMKDACDVTICIYHGGYEEDLATGTRLSDSTENVACRMARECEFDILLTGHQHMAVAGTDLYGSWSVQPPANAEQYVELELAVEHMDTDEVTLCETTSHLVSVGAHDLTRLEAYQKLLPLEAAAETWLDQPIGEFEEELLPEPKLMCGLHGSRVAAFFNQVQLESVDADISCAGLGNGLLSFPKTVSIRDVYAAYSFANVSVVKEITGRVLKAALERCAAYLDLDENGQPYIGKTFLEPKIEHYNYDFYAGIDYAFDLRKPHGERVVRLKHLDGREITMDETLRLVTSDYRATGTGGYEMIGRCPTVYTSADNVQDLIIDYIRSHHPVKVPENYRFEVLY